MNAVLEARGEMAYGDRALAGTGAASLALADVGYAYQGQREERLPVIHRISLDVTAGSTVAVVGPTGSGKSTLAGLLVRLVDPEDGHVLLDGVDLRALRRGQVAGAAALVPQATFVFDDTVRGNVTLGAPLPDDEVRRRCGWPAPTTSWRRCPRASTPGSANAGASLSGGQRQRLALARALVRAPRLLVLDDATSAVDPHVEARILAGLRATGGASTVIVIAYRMATIALADEVVYIERGRLVARGSHQRLMEVSEGYRRLVTAYQRDAEARERFRAAAGPGADERAEGAA